MRALYQLPGRPGYRPGTVVEVAGPHDRYGKVLSVIKEGYRLPNPCMVDGPVKMYQPCELTLYSIRGTGNRCERDGTKVEPLPVWGVTA